MHQPKKHFKIHTLISYTLMIIGLGILIFIYAPYIKLILPSEKILIKSTKEFTITIPAINAQSLVIENVDPWNKKNYQGALQKGVAQAKGTSFPGGNGTIFLFAHSSDAPWRITRTNTPFIKLPLLENGDSIFLSREDKLYEYIVTDKKTVNPYDTSFLTDLTKKILILQTCTPPGTDWKRLLIFAVPKEIN